MNQYGGGYKFDIQWFVFYNSIGSRNCIENYIPNDFFYARIDPYFNHYSHARTFDDKNYYELYFPKEILPVTIGRKSEGECMDVDYNPISTDVLIQKCAEKGSVIVKPAIGTVGGHGISFWNKATNTDKELQDALGGYRNIVVQDIISQSETISRIHPNSINTIRIMTLFWEGNVSIVSAVLRIGRGGAKVDNVSSGGIAVGIDSEGNLRNKAYDVNGNSYESHPTTGVVFSNVKIPNYDACKNLCVRMAPRFVRISRLISWDLALDENNRPVLIEVNLSYGQLDFHQMCNGPLFGD